MLTGYIILGAVGAGAVIAAFSWYRVVPPSEAHMVVTPRARFVASSDKAIGSRATYFSIPSFIPFFGRQVRKMDVSIKEVTGNMETYEKDQGRYHVTYSLKFRVNNVEVASETFVNDEDLNKQLHDIIQAAIRAVTVKYSVVDARAKKKEMGDNIDTEITPNLEQWGLKLINFVLVDFQDTESSKIISNISLRREVEIQSETREMNAEKIKQARVKEAEAEESAKKREIQRDEEISKREQMKKTVVAQEEKKSREKELEVTQQNEVRTAEIAKAKAQILAEQEKAVETINKDRKKLEGEGDRARAEEQAKGDAAKIRENGTAEAEAKEKLQAALNKFGDSAIRALTAEKMVEMQRAIGIASAAALEKADVKVFSGGSQESKNGFDLGQMISALQVSNDGTASAVINRIGRPNDLGITQLPVPQVAPIKEAIVAKKKEETK